MQQDTSLAERLVEASGILARAVEALSFAPPVHTIYNPLIYAAAPHEAYIRRFAAHRKRVLFWGMNPGPWGMAQTGVPFGEIEAVSAWMGIRERVGSPPTPHPKRPIEGFACRRSEVSGRRLWGLMQSRFGSAERFFAGHFVANYCPLVFMEESGRNRTPDKLPAGERSELFALCDEHARRVIELLEPEWVVGVGKFAEGRLRELLESSTHRTPGRPRLAGILHPSPANPRANREWDAVVTSTLTALGIW